MFHGYYDFLMNDIKVKSKPTTLHQKTCPICDSKCVNIYYSNQLDKYICKKCMDKLLAEKENDMRYIDADKLCEALKSMASVQYPDKQNTILGVVSSIENFPIADVVPKSEVEKWYHEYNVIKDKLKQEKEYYRSTEKLADKYFVELQVAKSEVDDLKRYIILNEDIAIKCKQENGEQNEEYWKGKISAFRQIRAYIDAELKKKYTDSNDI